MQKRVSSYVRSSTGIVTIVALIGKRLVQGKEGYDGYYHGLGVGSRYRSSTMASLVQANDAHNTKTETMKAKKVEQRFSTQRSMNSGDDDKYGRLMIQFALRRKETADDCAKNIRLTFGQNGLGKST